MSSYLEANWDDLTPVPQDDGPEPLAPISYEPEYVNAMDYFRAVALKDERSERALSLTEAIIKFNPAHYTVWHYRQQLLISLNKDLYEELNFITDQVQNNPKNYQLWHHRQIIIEKLGDSSRELPFIEEVLSNDSKNYHAWTYRQWVIKTYNLWDGELSFVDKLLEDDVRNNSAWNQRYFVIFFNPTKPTEEVLAQEIQYAITKIMLAPNNISPWNYVKGIISKSNEQDISVLEELCKDLEKQDIISPHALGCLVDIYESRAKAGSTEDKELAIKTCTLLEEQHDTIRHKYWNHRKQILCTI